MVKLIFPQEIEVWYILPAIRKKIALKLVERGLAQKEVAELMGVTPAAISQYKKQKRAKEEIFDVGMEKELERSIEKIVQNKNSLGEEIIRLNQLLKEKGIVCKIYNQVCALQKSKNCPYCHQK
ncbi:MAG TPA: helix-turn-helix domain-containing protein [Candidatus Nanoarchaeia archaeon]|nr:helix-turn-helix domain-containing protein [Candidatus Nanoarchaeia archaeon]